MQQRPQRGLWVFPFKDGLDRLFVVTGTDGVDANVHGWLFGCQLECRFPVPEPGIHLFHTDLIGADQAIGTDGQPGTPRSLGTEWDLEQQAPFLKRFTADLGDGIDRMIQRTHIGSDLGGARIAFHVVEFHPQAAGLGQQLAAALIGAQLARILEFILRTAADVEVKIGGQFNELAHLRGCIFTDQHDIDIGGAAQHGLHIEQGAG